MSPHPRPLPRAGEGSLKAALVDIGGTLWPNSWPVRATDGEGRLTRLRAALPQLNAEKAQALVTDIVDRSRDMNGGTVMIPERIRIDADALITMCLNDHAVALEPTTVMRVRRAMAIPIDGSFQPLPGAIELLQAIRSLGLRCVIASNTYWRDAKSYWDDFEALGMAPYVDDVVTSVDAGHLKPHPAVFELAVRAAGVRAEDCVVIGNKERNDVEPALAMGMKAILVYPDDPPPTSTKADAVAADLQECARVLRAMLEPISA
ncbi:MAG TPA: HAD family hydrolase [Candidatus Dormibacteraeota bacterium]|nr:HAD family hydrolase [Candidatus Dormibacteraeota bacterium]